MRRIILTCLALTLTSCDTAETGEGPAATEADAALNAATSAAAAGEAAPSATDAAAQPSRAGDRAEAGTVLIVGTSLTAGYGVGAEHAYPAVLQQMIDSAGLPFRVVNAGISGETSAGGLRRIDWSLQQPADVLVLELGANDALRGLDPEEMRANLDGILDRARETYPDIAIVIVGMEAPPNLGAGYVTRFRDVYADLAREYDAALVPFLLEGVAAEPSLNLEDGIHPNIAGHRILARNVWAELEPVLRQHARSR
ncbi:MAG TPA: arylesterase, partial [Longimicrobiales bacterium]|nr:arylesterase [Longimicrobiales bacterium]